MFVGEIYMGDYQHMHVVFDTGSDMLMIESADCYNCEGFGDTEGQVFNTTKEMINANRNEPIHTRIYGQV